MPPEPPTRRDCRIGCSAAPIRRRSRSSCWLPWRPRSAGGSAQGGLTGRLIELERAEPQNARFEVDVNRADWPELAELPGIGPTLAHRIVDCRRVGGPYADHADLRRRVRGIGPKTLESIRPYLRPMAPKDSVAGE